MSKPETGGQISRLLTWPGLVLAMILSALLALLVERFWFAHKQAPPVNTKASIILSNHILSKADDKTLTGESLTKVAQTFELLAQQHPEKQSLGYQLIAASLHAGLGEQAVYINQRLLEGNTLAFGEQDIRTTKARQTLINTLLASGKSNDAYDLAWKTLEQYVENPPDDPMQLAIAYHQNAQVNLSCVYPRCDRPEAMKNGLDSSNVAIELLQQDPNHDRVLLARTLVLKNWFLRERDIKIELLTEALQIFNQELGFYNEDTADAYVQLGRIYQNWDQDFAKAKSNLEKALGIYSALYGDNSQAVANLKYSLSDLHLDAGQFATAIDYCRQYLKLDKLNFSCTTAKCKLVLLNLVKAHFYSKDFTAARQMANRLKSQVDDPKQPYSLTQNIKATLLRLDLHQNDEKPSLFDLSSRLNNNETGGITAKNSLAESVLTMELLHGQLKHYPKALDNQRYLNTLRRLVIGDSGGYVPNPEKQYLAHRAQQDCVIVSAQFCQQLQTTLSPKKD